MFQICQARVQECPTRVSYESVSEYSERVFCQRVPQECRAKCLNNPCLTRVSHKSVPQESPTRVCHKSVTKECPTRLSEKGVKQECSARVAFNAIEHLLFAFHCSVGTLLLRELLGFCFRILLIPGFLKSPAAIRMSQVLGRVGASLHQQLGLMVKAWGCRAAKGLPTRYPGINTQKRCAKAVMSVGK